MNNSKKELLKDKLKGCVVDISVMILVTLVGFVIYQSKKHEKENQDNNIVNVLTNEKTR